MLGIIGAMDQEVSILKEKMEVKKIDKRASMEFYVGILNGKEVVIVKCGVGKVNAAVCTQILADCYQVEAVINTGVAGSLRAEINIGDIVVSTDALQHDMDAQAFGYEPGQIMLAGESAGGGLIYCLCLKLKELGMELPCRCFTAQSDRRNMS